ncbi:hypothetical protein M378DRAFT_164148 [Amanita muscaria Koide BX008]|uniref:Uncharacterized protein n=1 Tax=Amanita muscaria (strain Koide BX008) TaxID=946122 RepID=A0A0C2X3D2_AMAMK|nr:hypothetical protein M378DRAFT_164148 [Amanita muscaria Koide BX008]
MAVAMRCSLMIGWLVVKERKAVRIALSMHGPGYKRVDYVLRQPTNRYGSSAVKQAIMLLSK